MRDYIEHLRQKPEHVRKNIALLVSGGITGVVFLGWAVTLAVSGTLALNTTLPEVSEPEASPLAGLAGAASAFSAVANGESMLTVIETGASSSIDEPQGEDVPAVIPF